MISTFCGEIGSPASRGGANKRGILSFVKESIPLLIPREKGFKLAVSGSNGLCASGMGMPARGVAALGVARRFDLLLSSAVAQPLAALLPYGCGTPLAGAALPILQKYRLISFYRQSSQCGERSNAAFGKQSAAGQTSLAPHDSKARLISVTTCRRFMAKPCTPHPHCAARAALQAANPQCAGSRGSAPCVLLGVQGGHSLT